MANKGMNMAICGIQKSCKMEPGFTLVELSIVLVIIGLLIGGVLTGKSLIDAAAVRSQVSQIEEYFSAINTFQAKYGGLPGDLNGPMVTEFGFQPRGTERGQGDGNGLIEGNCSGAVWGWFQGCGENAVFWQDLSTAGLIDANISGFDVMGINYPYMLGFNTGPTLTSNPSIYEWLPVAKMRDNMFVYSFSVEGENYLAVSTVTKIGHSLESTVDPGFTVQEAYMVDSKMDDGYPQSGKVMACYVNKEVGSSPIWSAGGGEEGSGPDHCEPETDATPYLTTNCFDNNNVAGEQEYSLKNAEALNCGLSFKY